MTAHFVDELGTTFADRAGKPALIHRDRVFTFAELDERARRAAAWLQSLGVAPGDRVFLCTAEKLPFLVAHLGALYAGAVALPVNPRFPREELRYVLEDSSARVAVVGEQPRPLVEELRPSLPALAEIVPDADAWDAPAAQPRQFALAAGAACLMVCAHGPTSR